VVLSMAALPDVPSSKVIHALKKWAGDLEKNGGRLIIAGVSPAAAKVLQRGGVGGVVGDDGIIPSTTRVFGAIEDAVERGRQWIAERSG
jgi:sulfate permease, SulP family